MTPVVAMPARGPYWVHFGFSVQKGFIMAEERFSLCGMLVSEAVRERAIKTWPSRPATGYDDRSWAAATANHVLLVAREFGEEPQATYE